MASAGSGSNNPNWRGGRFVRSDGYVAVRVDGDYQLEHRVVMAGVLGRALRPDEHVHHRNHDKADNRPDNLVVLSRSDHGRQHPANPNPKPTESSLVTVADHLFAATVLSFRATLELSAIAPATASTLLAPQDVPGLALTSNRSCWPASPWPSAT